MAFLEQAAMVLQQLFTLGATIQKIANVEIPRMTVSGVRVGRRRPDSPGQAVVRLGMQRPTSGEEGFWALGHTGTRAV